MTEATKTALGEQWDVTLSPRSRASTDDDMLDSVSPSQEDCWKSWRASALKRDISGAVSARMWPPGIDSLVLQFFHDEDSTSKADSSQ